MKFYNREAELDTLEKLHQYSLRRGVMTVLTGRRRVGKTRLALEFASRHEPYIYLFFSRKSENLLCENFVHEITTKTGVQSPGHITTLSGVLQLLIMVAKSSRIMVIFDEFQEVENINPGFVSDLQKYWDTEMQFLPIHLIITGSVFSIMHRMFEDTKQPLFGRNDKIMLIKPFTIGAIKEILLDVGFKAKNLSFYYYALTGGMPRYIQFFIEHSGRNLEMMLDALFQPDSMLLNEARYLLIQEFGKEYIVYFSVLELIANGKNSRSELESVLQKDIGGYLERLENEYSLINKIKPLLEKPQTRRVKLQISEPYFNFWFQFIQPHVDLFESNQLPLLRDNVKKHLSIWLGRAFERYIRQQLLESGNYTKVGSWWDNKGQNEIDIVAINVFTKHALLGDVKLQKSKINLETLQRKAQDILPALADYQIEYASYSLD